MLFIFSILAICIFILLLNKQIKKYPGVFYIITTIITIGFIVYSELGLGKMVTNNTISTVISVFSRSALSVAMFTVVMYTPLLNKKWSITKKFYSIRGELSIMACILTLGHNYVFGLNIFPKFFTDISSLGLPKAIATGVSLTMIIIMVPLMITSFKCVRSKMKFKSWKSLQRSAYVFYGLIYVHIMCLFLPKISVQTKLNNIVVYSIIFIGYFILRINKAIKDKNNKLKAR